MLSLKLKNLRESHDYSMQEFCELFNKRFDANINKAMVSRWENGLAEPILATARQLCAFYNVSLDYLLDINSDNADLLREIQEELLLLDISELEKVKEFINFLKYNKK